MSYVIRNKNDGRNETHEHTDKQLAQKQLEELRAIAKDVGDDPEKIVLEEPETAEPDVEVVDHTEDETPTVTTDDCEVLEPEELREDPIGWLESINTDFVNTIKGTPAISKQGFRFIQSQFGITTESEMVHWIDQPTGVVVWARAEMPDGQSAEAHGEGYLAEDKVDDNEFVRYADTRAKNRAISDLTSAGALAVSELGGDND